MLVQLDIENIAVIEKAYIEFESGLNVITGETGAGKSLMINSLGMILGHRTGKEIIREGAPFARVSATFFAPDAKEFLGNMGIECEDDIVVTRKIYPDGRNVCHINQNAVNVSVLRELGNHLVVIHGQRDSEVLLDSRNHIRFIDSFMNESELKEQYKEAYKAYKESEKKLRETEDAVEERQKETDYLSYQIEQIENANLTEGEEEELKEKKHLLESAEKLEEYSKTAYSLLNRDGGVKDLLYSTMQSLEALSSCDESCSDFSERATNLYYEMQELARDVNSYAQKIDSDDASLREISDRLNEINTLKRRYNKEVTDILAYLTECKEKLELLLNYDEKREELIIKVQKCKKEALYFAEKLKELRHNCAQKLSERLTSELSELDMQKCTVTFSFEETELNENGIEEIEMLLSTNPIEAPKPLSKIASGGEMNRIMLAIKTVFSDFDAVPTLLFDEIDTGVSGRAAEKIAKKMHALSKSYQLISVTHLPVIASAGNHHILIEKNTQEDSFKTNIKALSQKERVEEIARIISGDNVDSVSIENASRMLEYYSK